MFSFLIQTHIINLAYYLSSQATSVNMTDIDQTKTLILHYIMESIIYVSTLKDNDTRNAGRFT